MDFRVRIDRDAPARAEALIAEASGALRALDRKSARYRRALDHQRRARRALAASPPEYVGAIVAALDALAVAGSGAIKV